MSIVVVVAAHPDDEVLGCGGTIAAHVANGDRVFPIFLADGVTSRQADNADALVTARQGAAKSAARALGCEPPRFLGFADNRLDEHPLLDVVQSLERELAPLDAEVIYTHHSGDLNVDHRVAHQAVLTACRPLPRSCLRTIRTFEVPSSTEWGAQADPGFRPNCFVDISPFMGIKQLALACYGAELRPFPHPRSDKALEALSQWRGACVGMVAAEAFQVERELWFPG